MSDSEGRRVGAVTVGVITYRRPDRLASLIPQLVAQVESALAMSPAPASVEIVVVDNDPQRSAESVARAHPQVHYDAEPEPGIAAARNRVLDLAAGSDLLAFIDDDESPQPDWLVQLLTTWRATGADLVSGPVVSEADGEFDPWVVAGGFLDRSHRLSLRTGDEITRAATNNLLVDLNVARKFGVRFDLRFGLSGGEDSLFTGSLVQWGARAVWCEDAVVTDHVPVARMTRPYMLDRTVALANATGRVEITLAKGRGLKTRARFLAAGIVRLVRGTLRAWWGSRRSSLSDDARGRREVARGRGEVAAVFGRTTMAYARPAPQTDH